MMAETAAQVELMLACGLLPRLHNYTDDLKKKINSGKFAQMRDVISRC